MLDALALLVATGVLWGCTNPFIRLGTQGLRKVRSPTRLGQIRAEIAFLLTNWRYVLPFLINQAGSISYVFAIQRAPLSLAVPAANSLAFAFTALTGAAIGAEEPLDTAGSISYVFAIQRAPLSLAVPAANSLAFAFTALTGAAIGAEEPLDTASILGIVSIIGGTALCCWDKAD